MTLLLNTTLTAPLRCRPSGRFRRVVEHAKEQNAKDAEEGDEEAEGEEEQEATAEIEEEENAESKAPVVRRFTYFAQRPFHPGRLRKLLKRGGGLPGVIRSGGRIWIATHTEEAVQWAQVGASLRLLPGKPWLAAKTCAVSEWPAHANVPDWCRTAAHGDRRTELGLIGINADEAAVRKALNRALVTRSEFDLGRQVWLKWEDRVSPKRRAGVPPATNFFGLKAPAFCGRSS